MGSIPREPAVAGPRRTVPAAPLVQHLAHLADSKRVALSYSDESSTTRVTYAELYARSNALAKAIYLRARPAGANRDGDCLVAVCMQPTYNTVIALLAIWKAGAAYVPIDPTFPQARIMHILTDAEPALVIYDDTANPDSFTESGVPAVSFAEVSQAAGVLLEDERDDLDVLSPQNTNSIAIVIYTSGITGIPKGVRLPYSSICNRLWWQFHSFPYSDSESTCVWKTPLTFVDSICEIWGPLLRERTLLVLSKETIRDPEKFVRVLSEHQVQRLVLVPTLLRSILLYLSRTPNQRQMLQSLKFWVCSGETLSKDLVEQYFEYFGDSSGYKLANFYGSTELMADVTYYVLEKVAQLEMFQTIPIGYPIDNCAVYLLDEQMNPVRESEPGQVWVAGDNLAAGYVGGQEAASFYYNPHAKHPVFGRVYHTGDYGTLHKGVLLFAGRTDAQVKIRGHRVHLQEVDRAVTRVQGVDQCVVLCYDANRDHPEILAFVTVLPEAKIDAHHIETSLKNSLASYMIPQVIEVENIPLLVSGKVDRQALLQMYENTNKKDVSKIPLDIDYTGVEPEALERAQVLFETVGEVLGRAVRGVLSVRVDFYELGGNSLNSILTITKLKDKGYYIKISEFLSAANLGEVLSRLATNPICEKDSREAKFKPEPMRNEHKEQVTDMIVRSFYGKAGPCFFNMKARNYAQCIHACWAPLLHAGLSVVLADATGTPVAVALNLDARDEADIKLSGWLAKDINFLQYLEGYVRDSMLPAGRGKILHSIMMATSQTLSARDNVAAIRELENETMCVAQKRRFLGVFTTNTSPLTQQLCTYILGFKTLIDCQMNRYVDSNGGRTFGKALYDTRAIVCWKPVEYPRSAL